ncbi:hypothetical protein ACU686_36040 [Yinghuangia aomiensis]
MAGGELIETVATTVRTEVPEGTEVVFSVQTNGVLLSDAMLDTLYPPAHPGRCQHRRRGRRQRPASQVRRRPRKPPGCGRRNQPPSLR